MTHLGTGAQAPFRDMDGCCHAVACDILSGDGNRNRVIVEGDHRLCTELSQSDSQNTRASTEIQGAEPWSGMLLEQAQTELRRRMEPGTEGHPWVKVQQQIIRLGLVLQPGGYDHRTLPNAHHAVVLFPGVGPILLLK